MTMSMRLPKPDLANPHVQRGLMLSAIVLVVIFFFFCTNFLPFFYSPREQMIAKLSTRVEKLTAEVEQAKRTTANLPRLKAEMAELHVRWEEATQLLPPLKEIDVLLRKVTVAGHEAGVDFHLFEPSDPVPGTFYTEHPVSVLVQGGYHDVGGFLASLAGMTRIVNVSELDLKALDQERIARDDGEVTTTVEAALTVTAYSLGVEQVDAGDPNGHSPAAGSGSSGQASGGRRSTTNEE